MNKWQRIQKVKALGLNTEHSVLVSNSVEWDKNVRWMKKLGLLSVRTFHCSPQDTDQCPHFPIITVEGLCSKRRELWGSGYSLIVAECIDPQDCLFAGAAMKRDVYGEGYSNLHIELARGPGTVRRVTNQGLIDVIYSYQERSLRVNTALMPLAISTEYERQRVYQCARAMDRVEENDIIFEFSYYRVPVGYMNQKFIVWEVTPADRR